VWALRNLRLERPHALLPDVAPRRSTEDGNSSPNQGTLPAAHPATASMEQLKELMKAQAVRDKHLHAEAPHKGESIKCVQRHGARGG
jgi:hypothetical protein